MWKMEIISYEDYISDRHLENAKSSHNLKRVYSNLTV